MEEAIKAFGWPQASLVFAVIFVFVFRRQIGSLLSRVTSIDKGGIKTTPSPEAQRENKKTEAAQELVAAIGDTVVLSDLESRIRNDLEQRGLSADGDTAKVLVKHLAATQLLAEFEQIQNFIFGSQIFLLKKLNEVAGQGQSSQSVEAHVEHVKKLFYSELNGWSSHDYLAFPLARSLITVNGNTYHITNLGVEYLTWLARNGRSENRPL